MTCCEPEDCGCVAFVTPKNGAGPTDQNEEAVLREEFGPPNEDGFYGSPEVE